MSSMRNATQRRNHRERAQPANREKWGLLEKHKDYTLRAKDYNEKKARLRILQQKAAARNPDEFHYAMLSSKSKQGRKVADRGNPVLSQDAVKLLKTQDSGYLRTVLQKTRRALEKGGEGFVVRRGRGVEAVGEVGDGRGGGRVVFVGSGEEQEGYGLGERGLLRIDGVGEGKGGARGDGEGEGGEELDSVSGKERSKSRRLLLREEVARKERKLLRKKHKKEQNARRLKMAALKTREKDLVDAENELELQRAKMSNSVGGVTKAGVKWKVRERKR